MELEIIKNPRGVALKHITSRDIERAERIIATNDVDAIVTMIYDVRELTRQLSEAKDELQEVRDERQKM